MGRETARRERVVDRFEKRARRKDSRQAVGKLSEIIEGRRRIVSDPPVLYPIRAVPTGHDPADVEAAAHAAFEAYTSSLNDARRFLLQRYTLIDVALKVVGVGSVGTRCLILLFEGRTPDDVFFLQAKEAEPSVLEEFLEPSPYDNHGHPWYRERSREARQPPRASGKGSRRRCRRRPGCRRDG